MLEKKLLELFRKLAEKQEVVLQDWESYNPEEIEVEDAVSSIPLGDAEVVELVKLFSVEIETKEDETINISEFSVFTDINGVLFVKLSNDFVDYSDGDYFIDEVWFKNDNVDSLICKLSTLSDIEDFVDKF